MFKRTIPLVIALAIAAPAHSADAVVGQDPAELTNFAKDFAQLRTALGQLQGKVDETITTISRNVDPNFARAQADELKATISKLLASVADNGPLAVAGELALSYARSELTAIQRDARFPPADRERLARQWNYIALRTSLAVSELTKARGEFLELLRILQTNEDFVLELEKLRLADETAEAISRLTAELREASMRLRDLTARMRASGV